MFFHVSYAFDESEDHERHGVGAGKECVEYE